MANLQTRIARIAEATLAARGFVVPVDVLIGLGWLAETNVDRWQWGRVTSLDRCISVEAAMTAEALETLRAWAVGQGLQAWETDYGELRFTAAADPTAERAFRTRWAAAEQPAPEAPRKPPTRLTVIAALNAWTCSRCGESGDLLLKGDSGGICLDCADLGRLVFLPSGDAALTRRARKASRLSAVVVRWNVRRNRYERQGILAENDAIEQAAAQCLEDADVRAASRDRDRSRRAAMDEEFRDRFADAIREQFPGCPPARAAAIASHAALRGSGRVGRSAAGRDLTPGAIRLAVTASVRHVDTEYDDLLMVGLERDEARERVRDRVDAIMAAWRDGVTLLER
ncbi:DUF2293 domain-containing protein [Mycolicibacterium rufum]|uniref:DUF2293 domain-containing protein n=1 Tax=Mycolicibacterium rufum TaxID=318424 RepID=A0A9X2YCE6_9MYCO|nr:DUF2293 domain-containing protein [Mycolicibacterium rufum]KGI66829.1 hypothetical protein EU78_04385 [Mycolicibacterium rufum]MCV7070588.1 DUF2293 domain-containing protein [Mycolicibacterium rufum]ULP37646.2 DUF2293 domain-containing protein [Mycolicibacterium rufum]